MIFAILPGRMDPTRSSIPRALAALVDAHLNVTRISAPVALMKLADGAANFMRATGADIRVTFKCASTNAARALGIDDRVGSILPGRMANIIFTDGAFTVKKVIFEGKEQEMYFS